MNREDVKKILVPGLTTEELREARRLLAKANREQRKYLFSEVEK